MALRYLHARLCVKGVKVLKDGEAMEATLLHDAGDLDEICKVRPLQALRG